MLDARHRMPSSRLAPSLLGASLFCATAAAAISLLATPGCRAPATVPAPVIRPSAMPAHEPDRTLGIRNHLPLVQFQNPTFAVMPARGPRIWFIGEREGRLLAVADRADATDATTVLDLRAHTLGWQDTGLLNLVLHPQFGQAGSPNRGFIYVWYNHTSEPHPGPDQPFIGHLSWNRLSRFTIADGDLRADPASELVLVEQARTNTDHQGGGMFFHPDDGLLYLAVGDGGHPYVQSRGVFFNTGTDDPQRLDRDLLSGVLRIDVDQRGGAISHPIRRQPRNGHTQAYFIPNDNPWNSPAGDVLEEFFAIGLRSPHRMTHDPGSGRIFAGDVGESRVEEVDVIERAGNYQWNFLEGALSYAARPAEVRGVQHPPLYALARAGRFSSIIGGVVYRGHDLPQLTGQYLFGDNGIGQLFRLDARAQAPAAVEPLLRLPQEMIAYAGLASFAVDREGEIYLCVLGQNDKRTGSLQKIVAVTPGPPAPATLSATGLFADLARLAPAPGGFAYQVNAPFWSDFKQKRRWLHLPAGAHIGFRPEGDWDFPAGTIAVKHFDLGLDENHPERKRRLETRVFVLDADGTAYGRTYKWRADGRDADLLAGSVTERLTTVAREGWDLLRVDTGKIGPGRAAGSLRLSAEPGTTAFAHTPAADDFDVAAHFGAVTGGSAGLMLRARVDGGAITKVAARGAWLRLRRADGLVTAFSSEDGQLWQPIDPMKLDHGAAEVGVYLSADKGRASAEILAHVRLLTRDHYYPTGDECMSCHTRSAHYILGASTRQWNRVREGSQENQLVAASHAGLFDLTIQPGQQVAWKHLAPIGARHTSVEDQVRSYLDANCAQCHRPGVLAQIRMDLRYDTPLAQQGLIRGLVRWPNVPVPNELIVIPKDLDRSRLYQRVIAHRMPPLGSLLVNQEAADLLERWIMKLDGPPVLRGVQILSSRATTPGNLRVELTSPDPAVTIHYTTDGSGPSPETPTYVAPFEAPARAMIRAIAFKDGFVASKLASRDLGH
jgi:glucose/arabinose dehydrogenase